MSDRPDRKRMRRTAPTPIILLIVAAAAVAVIVSGYVATGNLAIWATPTKLPTLVIPPTTPPLSPTVPNITRTTSPTPTPPPPPPVSQPIFENSITYGTSFDGRPLLAYQFGTGPVVYAIIGAIHGGYEWNTVVLTGEIIKYLSENPALVPEDVTLYIIPCANPDGYTAGTDREYARMNGNGVDLNRNWDYDWQPTATHGTRVVNAGAYPFSEPETAALRDFILERNVEAAIFYHSEAAQIFYGAESDQSATYELALTVSEATGYPIAEDVPDQITTGDAVDWMSAQGLAGIEVELTDHEDIEWGRNLAGLLAFLDWRPTPTQAWTVQTHTIGISVQGRPITVTQVGHGDQIALVIIGSIHGNEESTHALVQSLAEQYASTPESVPPEFTLYFAPTINPDGLAAHTRQNANLVDLNRNWPTEDWQADAARTSGIFPGSGGTAPGSEPEVQAVSHWLLDVKSAAQDVWLLSYHAAYPPDGGVQPGYTIYGTLGPQAEQLAQYVAQLAGYTYLPFWPSEYTFTGEMIHWCDVNGIWAADVELPHRDPPDVVPAGKSENALATHRRILGKLLMGFELDGKEQAQ